MDADSNIDDKTKSNNAEEIKQADNMRYWNAKYEAKDISLSTAKYEAKDISLSTASEANLDLQDVIAVARSASSLAQHRIRELTKMRSNEHTPENPF